MVSPTAAGGRAIPPTQDNPPEVKIGPGPPVWMANAWQPATVYAWFEGAAHGLVKLERDRGDGYDEIGASMNGEYRFKIPAEHHEPVWLRLWATGATPANKELALWLDVRQGGSRVPILGHDGPPGAVRVPIMNGTSFFNFGISFD